MPDDNVNDDNDDYDDECYETIYNVIYGSRIRVQWII